MISGSEPTLASLVAQISGMLSGRDDAPDLGEIRELCDLLYTASLLKEEGRAVRARIIIAPPEEFTATEGPPDGIHAIRFASTHALSPGEIKRLSPAASFFHSVIAVWPDGNRGIRIWGLLNTGPRWLNLMAGGRKPGGITMPFPTIHVRDPGWLLFYQNYELLAEWRGREFHGPRMDVFQSRLMNERFADLRHRLVRETWAHALPTTLSIETYAELIHRIALQFLKRIVNLVRSSGHGGTLVIIPTTKEDDASLSLAERWIDCKYLADPEAAGNRVRFLIQSMLRRLGELCPGGSTLEDAWSCFKKSTDPELDNLEESFFELARLYSDMMQVDGALVLEHGLNVVGFGGEIRVDMNVVHVEQSHDLERNTVTRWNVQSDGTRHRSLYRLCAVEPHVVGYVISQDGQVRMIANVNDTVTFWLHTSI
jgi:hypothetical protein